MLASTYPPPPPPPTPKHKSKTFGAALIIVIVTVTVLGVFFVATLPSGKVSPSPSSSASNSPQATSTATPKPTSTSLATPTPIPSGQTYNGYRAGAWANYTIKNYNTTGGVTARYSLGYNLEQGVFKGADCWIFNTELELLSEDAEMKTITTYTLSKSSHEGFHFKIQIYSEGELISLVENDYSSGDLNDIPTPIDLKSVVGKETIMVPAGTFICDKSATTLNDFGTQYVTTVWANSNVPVIGLVKQELASNGIKLTSTELVAYGG